MKHLTIEGLIVAIALAAFALWLLLVDPAGAAPARQAVTITAVNAGEGYYAVQLGDGRVVVVVPLTWKAPALREGRAELGAGVLWQGGWGYQIKTPKENAK